MNRNALIARLCVVAAAAGAAGTARAQATSASTNTAAAQSASAAPAPARAPAREAEEDEDDDTRRFWLDVSAGYSYINLVALDQSNLIPEPKSVESHGYGFEVGTGLQFSVVRVGVAGSYSRYSGFDAATAELVLGVSIPTPLVSPYIETGFGYGWITNVDVATASGSHVAEIRGIAIDLGVGLDFHVSDAVQFGVGVDASLLNLQRQAVTDFGTVANVDYTKEGTCLGLQLHGLARLTFQF